ncbi:MAG: nickel-dependent lactate racemase [Bacteroidales bacterium]|nr:nickel-dependent lactate racemase [Bacteroidales bacterium]
MKKESIKIHYGKEVLTLEVHKAAMKHILRPADIETVEDIHRETKRALNNPVKSGKLHELVKKGQKVVVLADDLTRLTPAREILPHVLDEINSGGVPDEDINLIVALGTHRPMTHEEIVSKYGNEVKNRIKVINHNCLDRENLKHCGITRRGTDIWVNRQVIEADVRVGVGNIVPHHPTGWSGGAKILLPGVAGEHTTGQFHLLGATEQLLGQVETPCREEMEDFAASTGFDFIINSVLDRYGRVVRLVAGDIIAAHREGVKWGKRVFGALFSEKTDITLSSTYPVDYDLFQADKGLFSAAISTRTGGEIILLSPCYEGISPTHPEVVDLAHLSDEVLFRLARDPDYSHDPLSIAEVLYFNTAKQGHKVTLISDGIPDNIIRKLGFNPVKPSRLQQYLDQRLANGLTLGVIHHSTETLPVLRSYKRKT